MFNHYIQKGSRRLRCGYTTGSSAAAAAKAAAVMLLGKEPVTRISLMTPAGLMLDIDAADCSISGDTASCTVIKDGGDDPDVTDGAEIIAEVSISDSDEGPAVLITGGTGVGRVTKKGLDQPVGEYAINSTPRRMITDNVLEVMEKYGFAGKLMVRISVPAGEEIAKRTFNPRLGIEGGISIIGTTGIVEPMSDSGILGTIRTELNMRKADGLKDVVLTIGNYSESFAAERLPFLKPQPVTCSNFIGDAMDMCMELGFERVLIVGHLGKLVKLGAGVMNTHSAWADCRMEVLVSCGLMAGADTDVLRRVYGCVTVDAALMELEAAGVLDKSMEVLAGRIQYYLDRKTAGKTAAGAVAFSNMHRLTVMTEKAGYFLNRPQPAGNRPAKMTSMY